MQLQKATRKKQHLTLNISGPAGAGKTMSALLMAHGLVGNWEKIALIDTENGSASLYSHLGPFNTIDLAPPFSPERYIEAIDTCLKAGMECNYEEGCPKIKKGNVYTVLDSKVIGGISPKSGRPYANGVYYKLLETGAWHYHKLFIPINEDQQDETEFIRELQKQSA